MRGKKNNPQFISEFIESCIVDGLDSPDQMAQKAKKMIQEIDEEIKQIEKRKLLRSDLISVVSIFERPEKPNKLDEIKILSFFKIKNQTICKHICDILKKSPSPIENLIGPFKKEEVTFSVKQLLEHKVIAKLNNLFLRGEMFEDYLKFVLRDI